MLENGGLIGELIASFILIGVLLIEFKDFLFSEMNTNLVKIIALNYLGLPIFFTIKWLTLGGRRSVIFAPWYFFTLTIIATCLYFKNI